MDKSLGVCKNCGKVFKQTKWADGRYSNKQYCSNECANEYYNKTHNKNKAIGICKNCGKEFKRKQLDNGTYSKSVFCSKDCEQDFYKKTHIKEAPKAICKYCGKEFEQELLPSGKYSNKQYCSKECMTKANTKKEKLFLVCKHCGNSFEAPYDKNGRQYKVNYCPNCKNLIQNKEIKRVCKNCGKEYIQIIGKDSSEFCSPKCKEEYIKKKSVGICKNCGKEFKQTLRKNGSYSQREFCSDTCYWEWYRSEHKTRKCRVCGKEFVPVSDEVVCSEECLNSGWEKKLDYRIRKCAYCGKEFKIYRKPKTGQFSGSQPIYCSEECACKGRVENIIKNYGEDFYKKLSESGGQAISKINMNFAELLNKNNIKYIQEYNINQYIYDFYLPELNKTIEIDPTYTHTVMGNHFNNFQYNEKYETYHMTKTIVAQRNNIQCIHIWQWDNWNKIIDIIKPKQKLYARKLQIKEINRKEANEFIDLYHLQNSCYGNKVNLGLFSDGILVQVMTFGKPRYNSHYQWELLRLCSHSDYIIIGGAEKLFKYFVRNYQPESIISYCDNSKFNGDVYLRLSFKYDKITKPQKVWSKDSNYITDNNLRQHGFDRLVGAKLNPPEIYGKGTNNEELMLKHNWLPVYDCGQKVFIWSNDND